MAEEFDQRRETATYADKINRLRHTTEGMSNEEMDKIALLAVDHAVYGFDARQDRHGNWIEQGIGSKGHETINHFAALRKFEGEESYRRAVAEIWKRDPSHAQKLGLPQPTRT